MAPEKKKKSPPKVPWKEQRVSAPAGLISMIVAAAISAGGVKLADTAWPTDVEVRLAKSEQSHTQMLEIVGFLAQHHIKTGSATQPPAHILALPAVSGASDEE